MTDLTAWEALAHAVTLGIGIAVGRWGEWFFWQIRDNREARMRNREARND